MVALCCYIPNKTRTRRGGWQRRPRRHRQQQRTGEPRSCPTSPENGATRDPGRQRQSSTCKDGKLLKSKEERQARWKNFEGVFNREAPPNPPTDEEMEEEELDIDK